MKAAGIVGPALVVAMMTCGVTTGHTHSTRGAAAECTGCHSMHSANAVGGSAAEAVDPSSVCLSCHLDANAAGPNGYRVATPEATDARRRGSPAADAWRGLRLAEEELHVHHRWRDDAGERLEPRAQHRRRRLRLRRGLDEHDGPRRHLQRIGPRVHLVSRSAREVPAAGGRHGRDDRCVDRGVGLVRHEPRPQAGRRWACIACWPGAGYTKGGVTFSGVPVALAPETYNRSESSTQTRVAYGHATGSGRDTWANWCATCHPQSMSRGTRPTSR